MYVVHLKLLDFNRWAWARGAADKTDLICKLEIAHRDFLKCCVNTEFVSTPDSMPCQLTRATKDLVGSEITKK
jgi:hypothetical protein